VARQTLVIALAVVGSILALPPGSPAADAEKPRVIELFEDEAEATIKQLVNDNSADPGTAQRDDEDCFSGRCAIRVTPLQRFTSRIKGWNYPIVEKPEDGQYRYIRFAWKKVGGNGIMVQLCGINDPTTWDHRYVAGRNTVNWTCRIIADAAPAKWELVTRDVFADFGKFTLTGIAFTPMDGTAGLYDHIYLGKSIADLDAVTDAVLGKTPIKDRPTAAQLAKCWDDLDKRDALLTAPARRTLIAADKDAVAFLKDRFKAREATDEEKKIAKLIADLDEDDFEVRENASAELAKLGARAEMLLKKTLAETKSPEVRRRIEALLAKRTEEEGPTGDQLRQLRAVRVLEQIGTPEAHELLEGLSKQALPPAVAGEVKIALDRWKKK
jgi:hypothetical protein